MKKPTRTVTKSAPLSSGECIRVVPMYQPKPAVSIDELRKARRDREKGRRDLFKGKPHAAPSTAKLIYQGGPLLTKVEVFTIFWGTQWGVEATSIQLMGDLNKFFSTILTSPAITQLEEYNVPGQKIGFGSLTGTKVISANAPADSVTDSTIQTQLQKWIAAKTIPTKNKNTLYFIYLDPGIVSVMGGSRSCQSYCGYHNNAGKLYYAVMPFPSCSGCLGGMSPLDALTGTSSHELCEAITDPVPGSGWYDDANGEIGDICAWNFRKVAGYTVQLEWSNQQNKCV